MGWKVRKGRRYYYTSHREGGRVTTRYHGGGAVAEAIARIDDAHREERAWEARCEREERARESSIDRLVAAFGRGVDAAVAEASEAAGYNRHHRGEWRKRRA